MKKNKISLMAISALLTLIAVFATSCEKEESVIDENVNNFIEIKNPSYLDYQTVYNFYLDSEQVDENQIIEQKSDLLFFEKNEIDTVNEEIIVYVYAFTSESTYIEFGDENNYKLEEQIEFEKRISQYISENNIEEYYLEHGKMPQSYIDYESDLYLEIFNIDNNQKSILVVLNTEENHHNGNNWLFTKSWPHFPVPGYNNNVSSFSFVGIYGYITMYDKSFYRKKIFTFHGEAGRWYSLRNHPANNKTSSFILWW